MAAKIHRRSSTADTNLVSVKVGPARLSGGQITNVGAAPRYLKLYNKGSAPVLASDTPVILIAIPAGQTIPLAACISENDSISFSAGIAYAITAAAAITDATVIAANDVHLNLFYY